MSQSRPSGSAVRPPPRPSSGPNSFTASGYEVVKVRLLIKLQDRLAALKARRMPPSLLAEAARQQVDQLVEVELSRLPPEDRARLAREVAEEAFGFGPLEELFADRTVNEITVLGVQAVLVRRGQGWLPTNVRFRDEDHLADVLEKVRGQGEAVAPGLPDSVLDVRLGNGFRAVAVVPPAAAGAAPVAAFVRCETPPAEVHPGFGSTSAATTPSPAGPAINPALGSGGGGTQGVRASAGKGSLTASGRIAPPPTRSGARPGIESPLDRHRQRITERFTAKLAALGVFDLTGIDSVELRKVIAAYVDEYCKAERVYLTDTDKGKVTLEILTGMGR